MMIGNLWVTKDMVPRISELTKRHPVTVARWINHGKIPPDIYPFLELVLGGNLGLIHDAWEGWSIDPRRGDLVTPIFERGRNRTYHSKDIFNMQITYQHLSALKLENEDLRTRCKKQEQTIDEKEERIAKLEAQLEVIRERQAAEWLHKKQVLAAGFRGKHQ